ncbi:hypothetical protein HPP92_028255 [Vanilla planifolia]|uniref:Protein kinase domain-containing protein n=1 Tax=Vanilla planifolia TaxID=51239 RepID=A0A835U662_VANPL|nr:hypothetical protein HPP92_028255 [Vanilla planifolia]
MEDERYSWLRRTSFSHTVYHRLDSSKLPVIPFASIPKKSSFSSKLVASISLPAGFEVKEHKNVNFNSITLPSLSASSDVEFHHTAESSSLGSSVFIPNSSGCDSKSKQRSASPLPTTALSDSFKEARAEKKRFSTPPPSRKDSEKGILGRVFSRGVHENDMITAAPQGSPLQHFFGIKNSEKVKVRKEATWSRYFDHGVGKVAAVDTVEEWKVDLSQLYLGSRFACGAHSRLYHGMYKDKPVAIKIIRSPDDDEDGVMALRLEKQFSREVNLLSRLHHRGVIKLVAACRNPPVFCIITEYLAGGSLRMFLHKLEPESFLFRNSFPLH